MIVILFIVLGATEFDIQHPELYAFFNPSTNELATLAITNPIEYMRQLKESNSYPFDYDEYFKTNKQTYDTKQTTIHYSGNLWPGMAQ